MQHFFLLGRHHHQYYYCNNHRSNSTTTSNCGNRNTILSATVITSFQPSRHCNIGLILTLIGVAIIVISVIATTTTTIPIPTVSITIKSLPVTSVTTLLRVLQQQQQRQRRSGTSSSSASSSSFLVAAWISPQQSPNSRNHSRHHSAGNGPTTTSTAFVATTTTTTTPKRTVTSSSTTSITSNKMSSTEMSTTTDTSTQPPDVEDVKQLTFRESLQRRTVNTWIQQLNSETASNYQKSLLESRISMDKNTNQTKRQVYNGHYVIVAPTPLPHPRLVLYSTDVAEQLLGFTTEQINEESKSTSSNNSNDFINFVSGNVLDGAATTTTKTTNVPGWATPYALSIMGTRYTNNCPYGTGNAYGDGRAISIAEIMTPTATNADGTVAGTAPASYELQLKGGGTTPFHRGADGRAVLRSSIREFLASEAMHYLNVPTTRALSLVVSTTTTIQRPWYKDQIDSMNTGNSAPFRDTSQQQRGSSIPTMDDPRLAQYSIEQRKQIITQMRRQNKQDPDMVITEPCAITCRVSTSFVRIGHLDLFARRAVKAATSKTTTYNTESLAWKELEQMIWHACYREYREDAYLPYIGSNDIASAATIFLQQSAQKLAHMVSQWIRVGFAQGNFNADNCLVGGYTMDYGPFGFMEEYDPLFAKWTGSGQHFGFLNQPSAAFANYGILVESVVPVIAAAQGRTEHEGIQSDFLAEAQIVFQDKVDEIFRVKLGFQSDADAADDVWEALEPLLRNSRVDYTLFFRELSYIVRDTKPNVWDESVLPENLLIQLTGDDTVRDGSSPFYEAFTEETRTKWIAWIQMWRSVLKSCYSTDRSSMTTSEIGQRMLQQVNPKYVLREWMLVEAYQMATNDDDGNESEIMNLYNLIQHPYNEGTSYDTNKYYRRAREDALTTGGTAFMS